MSFSSLAVKNVVLRNPFTISCSKYILPNAFEISSLIDFFGLCRIYRLSNSRTVSLLAFFLVYTFCYSSVYMSDKQEITVYHIPFSFHINFYDVIKTW